MKTHLFILLTLIVSSCNTPFDNNTTSGSLNKSEYVDYTPLGFATTKAKQLINNHRYAEAMNVMETYKAGDTFGYKCHISSSTEYNETVSLYMQIYLGLKDTAGAIDYLRYPLIHTKYQVGIASMNSYNWLKKIWHWQYSSTEIEDEIKSGINRTSVHKYSSDGYYANTTLFGHEFLIGYMNDYCEVGQFFASDTTNKKKINTHRALALFKKHYKTTHFYNSMHIPTQESVSFQD